MIRRAYQIEQDRLVVTYLGDRRRYVHAMPAIVCWELIRLIDAAGESFSARQLLRPGRSATVVYDVMGFLAGCGAIVPHQHGRGRFGRAADYRGRAVACWVGMEPEELDATEVTQLWRSLPG
jgi:hypothetical protein